MTFYGGVQVIAVNFDSYITNNNATLTSGSLVGFTGSEASTIPYSVVIIAPNSYNETLNAFKIDTPGFSLINVSPNLPMKITAGRNKTFTLNIKTPSYKYVGPLSITSIYSLEIPPTINISMINFYSMNSNLSKTQFGGAVQGFQTSSGSIDFETINITNGNGYTEEFTSFHTNTTGFSIVNVSPSLPRKISARQSQLFTIQIKTPNSNYSGMLSIIEQYNAPKPRYINVTQVNFFDDNVLQNWTFFSTALYGFNSSAGLYYPYSFNIDNSTSTVVSFITNTTGFRILNVTPTLPLKLGGKTQTFTLRIATPNASYTGPISIIEQYK